MLISDERSSVPCGLLKYVSMSWIQESLGSIGISVALGYSLPDCQLILKVLISVPSMLISIGPDDQPFRMGVEKLPKSISTFLGDAFKLAKVIFFSPL